jgi:hypothetical protein
MPRIRRPHHYEPLLAKQLPASMHTPDVVVFGILGESYTKLGKWEGVGEETSVSDVSAAGDAVTGKRGGRVGICWSFCCLTPPSSPDFLYLNLSGNFFVNDFTARGTTTAP